MHQTEFCANLRLLCDHFPSVAEVCRRLGLNRSQFNKYLNGTSAPSRHSLKRICDFFGVEPYEIMLPREQFADVLSLRPEVLRSRNGLAAHHQHIDRLLQESRERLNMYLGFYHEYYYSMSSPGLVLRSLVRVAAGEGGTYYRRYERLRRTGERGPLLRCDYRGIACFLSDRIFLTDYESLTGNEITHTILYPSYRCRVGHLCGVKLGVSSGASRHPACCRVLWEHLGTAVALRAALARCRLYDPGSGEIEPDILEAIDNHSPQHGYHFLASPQ